MTNNNSTTITLPSMLSFERKLEASDGLMCAGSWEEDSDKWKALKANQDDWKPITIGVPRKNRGTQSMYMEESKRADTIKPNPVEGDDASLPMDKDTLKLSFFLRVIGSVGKPFACNSPAFAKSIQNQLSTFKASDGMNELALRYAYNIANGRFLWRNRVGAEEIQIQVYLNKDESPLTFNAYDFSLNNFDKNWENENLNKLADAIKIGLSSDEENSFVFLKVDTFVKLGDGQHVFPSQEMNIGEKKKKLFQLNDCAAMHNVKIGNAIRTIDTWYGDTMLTKTKNDKGKDTTATVDVESAPKLPIAVEPYGSVTQHGRAYRHKDIDLYTLMKSWVNGTNIEEDQKFVVANLIRGGVFGGDAEG